MKVTNVDILDFWRFKQEANSGLEQKGTVSPELKVRLPFRANKFKD
jgi:hypothetical protein